MRPRRGSPSGECSSSRSRTADEEGRWGYEGGGLLRAASEPLHPGAGGACLDGKEERDQDWGARMARKREQPEIADEVLRLGHETPPRGPNPAGTTGIRG